MPECGGQCSDFANCHAKNVLIDGRQFHTPWRFSGIAVSPVDPNLLVRLCIVTLRVLCSNFQQLVGTGVYGRLFDRRMLSLTSGGGSPPVPIAEYAPRHLSGDGDVNALVTCVSFSPSGRRVVVNYNCDHAYVFDVDNRNDAGIGKRSLPSFVGSLLTVVCEIVIKSPSPSRLARRIGQMRRKAVDAFVSGSGHCTMNEFLTVFFQQNRSQEMGERCRRTVRCVVASEPAVCRTKDRFIIDAVRGLAGKI